MTPEGRKLGVKFMTTYKFMVVKTKFMVATANFELWAKHQ